MIYIKKYSLFLIILIFLMGCDICGVNKEVGKLKGEIIEYKVKINLLEKENSDLKKMLIKKKNNIDKMFN